MSNSKRHCASAAYSMGTANYVQLVASKTIKWQVLNQPQHGSQSIDFPVDIGDEYASMTWMFVLLRYDNWDLSYSCITENGKPKPKHKVRICHSLNDKGIWVDVHESDLQLQQNDGTCSFPKIYPSHIDYTFCIKITLEFYEDRIAWEHFWNKQNENSKKKQFMEMLETGHLSDVEIVSSDGKKFNAHKLILKAGSEVFDVMFNHDMKESTSGVIKLDDISGKGVKFLLHFMYSSELLPVSAKENDTSGEYASIEEVLYFASKYRLNKLIAYVDESIGKFCNEENAWHLLKLCKLHSLEKGTEVIFEFMRRHPTILKDLVLSQV